jgi:hypothetical protein
MRRVHVVRAKVEKTLDVCMSQSEICRARRTACLPDSALSNVEQLALLVRKEFVTLALMRHFVGQSYYGSRFLSGTTASPSEAGRVRHCCFEHVRHS